MFERNRVLRMLEARQLPLGIQCFTGDPALIEEIGSNPPSTSGSHNGGSYARIARVH
jgi:hypothetical protein